MPGEALRSNPRLPLPLMLLTTNEYESPDPVSAPMVAEGRLFKTKSKASTPVTASLKVMAKVTLVEFVF